MKEAISTISGLLITMTAIILLILTVFSPFREQQKLMAKVNKNMITTVNNYADTNNSQVSVNYICSIISSSKNNSSIIIKINNIEININSGWWEDDGNIYCENNINGYDIHLINNYNIQKSTSGNKTIYSFTSV